jgi:hypothetical protein
MEPIQYRSRGMTSHCLQQGESKPMPPFYFFVCFLNFKSSHARPNVVSWRCTLAHCPSYSTSRIGLGQKKIRPILGDNPKRTVGRLIRSGQVSFSPLQYLSCFLRSYWKQIINLVNLWNFSIEMALFGICKSLTYLWAVIGRWLWPLIDYWSQLAPFFLSLPTRWSNEGKKFIFYDTLEPSPRVRSPTLPTPNVHPAMSVESTVFRAWIKRNWNMA